MTRTGRSLPGNGSERLIGDRIPRISTDSSRSAALGASRSAFCREPTLLRSRSDCPLQNQGQKENRLPGEEARAEARMLLGSDEDNDVVVSLEDYQRVV